MKTNSISRCIRSRLLLLALVLADFTEAASAATYQVGNLVTNFTLVARRPFTRPDGTAVPAGALVNLSDFVGRIVFLEWFAVWCPYCVAAAPQVKTGIVDYYAARGGNPSGLPVLHIAANQEANSGYQGQTDSFVTQQGFNPVMNDYNSTSTNRVRFLFQNSGQPIFVVINGVTNSPSHQPWQLLVNHLGYGQTDFNQTLAGFRAVIDTVQAPPPPPPQLTAPRLVGANFEFNFQALSNRVYRVETSTNLTNWVTLRTISNAPGNVLVRDTNAPPPQRFYRAVTP